MLYYLLLGCQKLAAETEDVYKRQVLQRRGKEETQDNGRSDFMSTMHGPRKDKKSREENYQMFFKCAIALGILITLSVIAQIATGGLG